MTPSLWRLSHQSPAAVARWLAMHRLALIALSLIGLLIWHKAVQPIEHRLWVGVILLAAGAWSIAALSSRRWLALRFVILRECLFDIAWVGVVIYCAGASSNPFIYYLLVLIALAAVLLPKGQAWGVCALAVAVYSAMLLSDVQAHFAHFDSQYRVHLIGMWVNFGLSAWVICFGLVTLMAVSRQQAAEIQAIREKNLKREQLIGLATVCANTLHDLATPLATLRLLSDEWAFLKVQPAKSQAEPNHSECRAGGQDNTVTAQDVELFCQQIQRCEQAMQNLTELTADAETSKPITVTQLVENLRDYYALRRPDAVLVFENTTLGCSAPTPEGEAGSADTQGIKVQGNQLLQFALVNIINNAIDAAAIRSSDLSAGSSDLPAGSSDLHVSPNDQGTRVVFSILPDSQYVQIMVTNAVPNTSEDAKQKISNAESLENWGEIQASSKPDGLGIGSFLANSTIEQFGGTVSARVEIRAETRAEINRVETRAQINRAETNRPEENRAENDRSKDDRARVVVSVVLPILFASAG